MSKGQRLLSSCRQGWGGEGGGGDRVAGGGMSSFLATP